jgi:hypothetical protein
MAFSVWLVGTAGVWSLVIGSLLGEIISIAVMLYGLRQHGHDFKPDRLMLSPLVAAVISCAVGLALVHGDPGILQLALAASSALLVYFVSLFVLRPISASELAMIRSLSLPKTPTVAQDR